MPWSTDNLPSNVAKLGETKQRQWMHVANECLKDGKDEGTCIRMANGVVKKSEKDFDVAPEEVADDDAVVQAEKDYQYVGSYEYEERQITQAEANYDPVGGDGEQACSNCRFFVSPARCTLVSGIIAPNGKSEMWTAKPATIDAPAGSVPVYVVNSDSKEQVKTLSSGGFANPGVIAKAARALAALVGMNKPPEQTDGFLVTKQSDGRLRFFTRYSNAWKDRDGEIITEKAHREYVDWANAEQVYPELWLWHTKGTRFGQVDWLDFADGFSHASGLIDEGKENIVASLAGKELGVSHGFFSVQDGNFIEAYRSFEISVLPQERAAVWTADFNIMSKETELMAFTPERRAFLVGTLGEETVKQLEQNTKSVADQLRAAGVEYKEADAAAAEAAEQSEALKAIAPTLVELTEGMKTLSQAFVALKQHVDETAKPVEKQVDEAVEDAFLAKLSTALKSSGLVRPTEDNKNVEADDSAKTKEAANQDFMATMVAGAFGGFPGSVPDPSKPKPGDVAAGQAVIQ